MSKDGRKFFYFPTAFFADRKVKILKARYGSDGMILYIYLMCEIFREDGYFLRFDDDFEYIISSELNMNYEKIGQILNFLLERSLFSDTLFKSDKVLTSREIQLTFQEAVKGKAVKNPVAVRERLWLLKKDETAAFIKVQSENEYSENLDTNSEKITPNSRNLSAKQSKGNTKQMKVKQSKVKPPSPGESTVPPDGKTAAAAAADQEGERIEKIEEKFHQITGRWFTSADSAALDGLYRQGADDELILRAMNEVAGRKHPAISSMKYFIPVVQDAIIASYAGYAEERSCYERRGMSVTTSDTEDIEAVLDAEWAREMQSFGSGDYNYDDGEDYV